VNLAGFLLLREGAGQSLAMRAAYLEVLADLVGSIGVIIAALLIAITGEDWIDPCSRSRWASGSCRARSAWAPLPCACCCRPRPRTST